jgi:rhodanese-related sulfurtransferase
MQAHLALLTLLDLPEASAGSVRLINLLTLESRRISVARTVEATRNGIVRDSRYYDSLDPQCERARSVTAEQLRSFFADPLSPILIDLSTDGLLTRDYALRAYRPADLDTALAALPRETPLLFYCEGGIKSAFEAERVSENNRFSNAWRVSEELLPLLMQLAKSQL